MLLVRMVSSVMMLGVLAWPGPAAAGESVYDARIEERLPLTPEQLPHVRRIVDESKQQFLAVFNKHGIDPNGPPVFRQLVRAGPELMAIGWRQRRELSRVLTREQLVLYDRIMKETRRRVREAAQ